MKKATSKTSSDIRAEYDFRGGVRGKYYKAMHKIMNVAMSGQNFTPSQLLALQQATYKVTFEMETMSKLVEQASSAVKTTMQTQV
jgi:hypothetical protein